MVEDTEPTLSDEEIRAAEYERQRAEEEARLRAEEEKKLDTWCHRLLALPARLGAQSTS